MLSVLIPCYNFNVTALADELHRQLSALLIEYEIVVIEDGSTLFLDENQSVGNLQFVTYNRLEKNIGRAKIRNLLAKTAKHPYLLFLDCDTAVYNPNFIKNYLPYCKKNCVVAGGTTYEKCTDKNYALAHKYGSERERWNEKNIKNKEKYPIFTTPNFLIDREIFNKVDFDETITDYGHEDMIFGLRLAQEKLGIVWIDNSVIHKGLDNNINYLKKAEISMKTFFNIYQSNKYPELQQRSKILSCFVFLKKIKMNYLAGRLFMLLKSLIIKNLSGKSPSLFLFDCYKLGVFLCMQQLKQQKHKKIIN